jgi:hypothetical protein
MRRLRNSLLRRLNNSEPVDMAERRMKLLNWLNNERGTPEHRRVRRLINDINIAREASPSLTIVKIFANETKLSNKPRVSPGARSRRRINDLLRKYDFRPRAERCRRAHSFRARPGLQYKPWITWKWSPEDDEASAIIEIVKLEEDGLFNLLRGCPQCGAWFYAERAWHKFCSPSCRAKKNEKNRKTPAARTRRAEYMRRYRALLRRIDQVRIRQSKTVKSEHSLTNIEGSRRGHEGRSFLIKANETDPIANSQRQGPEAGCDADSASTT